MLFDDLKQLLKEIEPDLATIKAFWQQNKLEEEYKRIEEITHKPDFWQHKDQAQLSKQLRELKELSERYRSVMKAHTEFNELLDLFAHDEPELEALKPDIWHFCKEVRRFKINLLLQSQEDNANCFLSVNAGAGGTESQDWADMLLRMYLRFCERNNLTAKVIDYQVGETAGIKSATLFIKGKKAYGLLKGEAGIHRLVRISPYDANKRRHTSFAAITVNPEVPDVEITINPNDLRIDTYRAGGAGGQHVNKTDSAVRITHLTTNIVVQCQNERSQLQNKETAMKMLMAKLAQKQKEEEEAKKAGVEKKKIEWGSQIRSYVLHPYKMVKDHRTNTESSQPDQVLDGELMNFIENYLIKAH